METRKWKFDDEALFQDDFLEPQPSLSEINNKLDLILQRLNVLETGKVVEPQPVPTQKSYVGSLHAPANAAPKGSMLEEIQSVLTAQAVTATGSPQGDVVSSTCSLPVGMYDDSI